MKRGRDDTAPPNVLMLGTGEYTTGFVGTGAADSDKGTGVVALVMLDLKRRGKVGRVGMCGTNGKKLPQIRAHMQRVLGDVYEGIEPSCVETWPADGTVDDKAYLAACQAFEPGDVAIIFTPDDTHFAIAAACLKRGARARRARRGLLLVLTPLSLSLCCGGRRQACTS
jgi:D-galacturonate reductase